MFIFLTNSKVLMLRPVQAQWRFVLILLILLTLIFPLFTFLTFLFPFMLGSWCSIISTLAFLLTMIVSKLLHASKPRSRFANWFGINHDQLNCWCNTILWLVWKEKGGAVGVQGGAGGEGGTFKPVDAPDLLTMVKEITQSCICIGSQVKFPPSPLKIDPFSKLFAGINCPLLLLYHLCIFIWNVNYKGKSLLLVFGYMWRIRMASIVR